MIPSATQAKILKQFDQHKHLYAELGEICARLIEVMLQEHGVRVHAVTWRCKERPSLAQKLGRPDKEYEELDQITDLAGVRVITYFDEDVDQVAAVLEEEFAIDQENSIDKRKLLGTDRFGYQSLHFVASLSGRRCELPEYKRFAGRKLEMQVRSILQHAWAEIEHDLGYKTTAGVPQEIRRRFSCVAGLLETVDREFRAIAQDLRQYESALPQQIEQHPEQVELDFRSLKSAYASSKVLPELDRQIAKIAGAAINLDADYVLERAAARLIHLGISSIAALEQAARQHAQKVIAFARHWWAGDNYTSLEVGVGTTYLCYWLVGHGQDKAAVLEYLRVTSTAGVKLREKMADNILSICARVDKA